MMQSCPHCGAELVKPRSPQDHRRLFALIAAAFDNWPHDHEFKPDNAEHLRAYLLCEAGYRRVVRIPIPSDDGPTIRACALAARLTADAFADEGSYAFIRPEPKHGGLVVIKPKSIKFEKLDQKAFAPIREAVETIIRADTDIEPEQAL